MKAALSFLIALLCSVPAIPSLAAIDSLGEVAGWDIEVDEDQAMCSMTRDSGPSGQNTLSVIESPDQTMSIIATSESWRLHASSQVAVTLALGRHYSLKSDGYTTDDGQSVIVVLGADKNFMEALAENRRLNLTTGRASVSFPLDGVQAALGAVAACIVNLNSDDDGGSEGFDSENPSI